MISSLADLDKMLAEMREKIVAHEKIAEDAQKTLDSILETGALVQKTGDDTDPDRQGQLGTLTEYYEEVKGIVAEHTQTAEQLKLLEEIGDRLRSTLLPYEFAGGRE